MPIRVLIIDDSAVARAALTQTVCNAPAFEVAAAFDGATRAIEWLLVNDADIILLDLQMPGIDGLSALPALLGASRGARVLIVSTLAEEGARAAIEALALGATDTLAKPAVGGLGRQFGDVLIDKMLRLGSVRPVVPGEIADLPSLREGADGPVGCLAIGASTGGLHALSGFFAALPASFDAPILVTQHLPPVFMRLFADQLATMSGRLASVATDGQKLVRRTILVAPGDRHLGLRRVRGGAEVALRDELAVSRCCPSVDPMFVDVGRVFRHAALAVVLTGMGRDGEIGSQAVADHGGTVIVQDATTSAVWGMPGSVARAGLASMIASPAKLAAYATRRGSVA